MATSWLLIRVMLILLYDSLFAKGYDMCPVEVDNDPVVFKVPFNNDRDILNFKVDEGFVANCVIMTGQAETNQKYKHQYNSTLQHGQCIFTILYLKRATVIVSITSETKDLVEVSINGKIHQGCNDTSSRSFILKAKGSEVQDNGLPVWVNAVIGIGAIGIGAILIVILCKFAKTKASYRAQNVDPEASVPLTTLNVTGTKTNENRRVPVKHLENQIEEK